MWWWYGLILQFNKCVKVNWKKVSCSWSKVILEIVDSDRSSSLRWKSNHHFVKVGLRTIFWLYRCFFHPRGPLSNGGHCPGIVADRPVRAAWSPFQVLKEDEGGRKKPFFSSYRPQAEKIGENTLWDILSFTDKPRYHWMLLSQIGTKKDLFHWRNASMILNQPAETMNEHLFKCPVIINCHRCWPLPLDLRMICCDLRDNDLEWTDQCCPAS